MPTYDGIGTSITHNVEVDGNLFLQDIEGGPDSTRVPLEIFSDLVSSSVESANSRMLRLRVNNYGETDVSNSYVTDMGIRGDPGKDYFFITAPQNTSNVGDQNTFVISKTSNVGIGTTNPEKPLHVVGDSWITGTLTASNIIGASPVTISSGIVMGSGSTLTTSNIVANTGDNLRINSTGAMIVPVGTTAQQPTTAYAGMLRFNSTLNKMEYYNNSSQWIPISLITTTGGNDVFIHNNYKIHVFTGGGNFILDGPPGRIDVLMVAGGGGGGTDNAGGGGAGGLIFKPDIDIQPGNYFISVGTGGTGSVVQGTTATAGGDTTAFGLTAKGGGYGNNGNPDGSSNSGGSGGGGDGERNTSGGTETQSSQSGDSSTYGHGNDGGNYGGNSGGGGGGAGTAGANGDSVATGVGGVGGDGLYQVTIGSTTYNFSTMFGTSYGDIITSQAWFAGGGGGGNDNSNTTDVAGGKGGGGTGKGANWTSGDRSIDGDANTGGGGAGATYSGSQDLPGGNGGSGIVIIRIHN